MKSTQGALALGIAALLVVYSGVLDRIHVDIIAMSVVILLVADPVFPIAWLPNTDPVLIALSIGRAPIPPAGGQVVVRKPTLNLPPPFGKVIVVLR